MNLEPPKGPLTHPPMAPRRKPSQYRHCRGNKIQVLRIPRTNTALRPVIGWSTSARTASPSMDYASTTKRVPSADLGTYFRRECYTRFCGSSEGKDIPFVEREFFAVASLVGLWPEYSKEARAPRTTGQRRAVDAHANSATSPRSRGSRKPTPLNLLRRHGFSAPRPRSPRAATAPPRAPAQLPSSLTKPATCGAATAKLTDSANPRRMPTIPDGHEAPPTMDCTFVALTRTQGDNPVEILNEDEPRIVAGGTESRRRYAEDPGRRSPRGPGRRGAGRHTTGAWRRAGDSASPAVPIRSGHRTARRRPTSCRVSGLGYRGLDKLSKALVSW